MKRLVFLSALILGLLFVGCSEDDDVNPVEQFSLVGDWQLTNVDFTVMTEGGRPASDACIVELVSGYEFHADSKFYFILGETERPLFDPYAADYWRWEGDINDFVIIQNNPMSPPYNFGLTPTDIVVKRVEGKTVMTFHSEMGNGSAADFTLVKGSIDRKQFPVLTKPDGSPYHCGFFD